MKVKTVALSLVGVALLSATTIWAGEGEAGAGSKRKPFREKKAAFFTIMDTDGDGSISLAEFTVMHDKRIAARKTDSKKAPPTAEEAFAKKDADKDGFLSKNELKGARTKVRAKKGQAPAEETPAQ